MARYFARVTNCSYIPVVKISKVCYIQQGVLVMHMLMHAYKLD